MANESGEGVKTAKPRMDRLQNTREKNQIFEQESDDDRPNAGEVDLVQVEDHGQDTARGKSTLKKRGFSSYTGANKQAIAGVT